MCRYLIFIGAIAVAGCASAAARPIQSYPEGVKYADCIIAKAKSFATEPDSPVDLAVVVVGACRPEQNRLETALRKDNRPVFVNTFMARNRRSMIEFAAEVIVETRRRNRQAR